MRRYQPMWENWQTVGPQERDCENRYLAIAPYVPAVLVKGRLPQPGGSA